MDYDPVALSYNYLFLFHEWIGLPYQNLIVLGSLIFWIGFFGIVFNRKNFLVTMLCIELTYLGCSFIFIVTGVYFLEPTGQLYALILILLAASEAAIGLGLLIVLYKISNTITLSHFYSLAT